MLHYIRGLNPEFQGALKFSYGIFNSLNIACIVLHLHSLTLYLAHEFIKFKEI